MRERVGPHCGIVAGRDAPRLSYKFQRLREELRSAILGGEFGTRLPGERALGRRFHANPKTVNKALCDLSSEGLVVRHIGRGTFVAERDGQSAESERRRRFQCLLPAASNGAAGLPTALDTIREILEKQGHDFEWTRAGATHADGIIALPSWKPRTRRATDGLLCCPLHPLSGGSGHLGEDAVVEALRRQVSVVVLGAYARGAKLNAVVPDFADAGFQAVDYLCRLGCGVVVALHNGTVSREATMALNGCRTAATRHGGELTERALPPADGGEPAGWLEAARPKPDASRSWDPATRLGVVCVGDDALRMAMSDPRAASLRESGQMTITSVPESASRLARDLGLTAYEVDADLIASWAARLLVEVRPGDQPVEVVVPGRMQLRSGRGHPGTTKLAAQVSHAGV